MLMKIIAGLSILNTIAYVLMSMQLTHDWGVALVLWIPPLLSAFIIPFSTHLIVRFQKNNKSVALPLIVTIIAIIPFFHYFIMVLLNLSKV